MRRHLILVGLVITLGGLGWSVAQKEAVLADGETVLLQLAPVDPRSLMQGDYMVLNYQLERALRKHYDSTVPGVDTGGLEDGVAVLKLDEKKVATLVRIDDGTELAKGEVFLRYTRYRQRFGSRFKIGAESFFFQEGTGSVFDQARYGELKLDKRGASVLIGLRDKDTRILGAEQRLHKP